MVKVLDNKRQKKDLGKSGSSLFKKQIAVVELTSVAQKCRRLREARLNLTHFL